MENQQQTQQIEKPKKPIWKRWWFWIVILGIMLIISAGGGEKKEATPETTPSSQTEQTAGTKPEITQPNQEKISPSYPSYTEIFTPFSLEANKSFYIVVIPKPEIFPEFLNYLAEKHCPLKKKYPVCVINVYKHPKPEEICLNPDVPWKECEAITIGHWDNFPQPIRWFRDSSGNKINF